MKVFADLKYLKSFSVELPLRGGHFFLGLITTYMGYKTYTAYTDYVAGLDVFENNRKEINKSILQRKHQVGYKNTISVSGYPDEGNWLLSNLLPAEEWVKLSVKKARYEELYKDFSIAAPMMILLGFQFPWVSCALGAAHIYLNDKLSTDDANLDRQKYRDYLKSTHLIMGVGAFVSSIQVFRGLTAIATAAL